jgi:hypothetical protein
MEQLMILPGGTVAFPMAANVKSVKTVNDLSLSSSMIRTIASDIAISRANGTPALPSKEYVPYDELLDAISGQDFQRIVVPLVYYKNMIATRKTDFQCILDPKVLFDAIPGQNYRFSSVSVNAISDNTGAFTNIAGNPTTLSFAGSGTGPVIGYVIDVQQTDINFPATNLALDLATAAPATLFSSAWKLPQVLSNGQLFVWNMDQASSAANTLTPAAPAAFGPYAANSVVANVIATTAEPAVTQVSIANTAFSWVIGGAQFNLTITPVMFTRDVYYALYAALANGNVDLFALWAMSHYGNKFNA